MSKQYTLVFDREQAMDMLGKMSLVKDLSVCIENKTAGPGDWLHCLAKAIEIARDLEPKLRAAIYSEFVDAGIACKGCFKATERCTCPTDEQEEWRASRDADEAGEKYA